jgi:hypothetical protein
MTSVVILVRNLAKEFQLEVVIFTREKENEITLIRKFVYVVKDAMRADKWVNTAHTTNKCVLWSGFSDGFLYLRNNN